MRKTSPTSSWFQALFSTRPLSRTQALQEFRTTAHGSRLATSVGGVLTGRGADIIIIDDPLKPEEAMSESQRRAVINGSTTPSSAGSTTSTGAASS
jgi:hypothetical protein